MTGADDDAADASASDRAQSLIDEIGGDLDDLDSSYRSAREAIADEDDGRRAEAASILASGADRPELVRQILTMRGETAELTHALATRDEHVKALREQVDDLEERLERAGNNASRVVEVENEVRRFQRDNEKLSALLDAREVERDEIGSKLRSLEVEKVQLRRETESIQSDLSTVTDERIELRKQVQKLEAELVRNRRDHEARRVQLEASAEERNELSKKVAAIQEERAADLDRINELEALVERRDNELNHLKKAAARQEAELTRIGDAATELELRTAERDNLRRRVESLESELTASTTEAGASKKALELLASRTSERDELEKRVIELERQLARVSAAASTADEAATLLERTVTERNVLEQRMVEIEAELARERTQNAEWREAADLVATMAEERDRLRRRLSVVEAELEDPERHTAAPVRLPAIEPEPPAAPPAPTAAVAPPAPAAPAVPNPDLAARIAALEAQLGGDTAEASSASADEAAAAFEKAMAAAAEMRASLAKAAELMGTDTGAEGITSEDLDVVEPLWALNDDEDDADVAAALTRTGDVDDNEPAPTPEVYGLYREALQKLEEQERAAAAVPLPPPSPAPTTERRAAPAADATRGSSDLAQVLFSSRDDDAVVPGVDVAARPIPEPAGRRRGGRPPRPSSNGDVADRILRDGATVLIDGRGVLDATRYPGRFLDAAERVLSSRGVGAELVFDGSAVDATPELASRDAVEVRFAQGVAVEEVVLRLLDRVPAQSRTVVATDDRNLASEARRLDAEVITVRALTALVTR